MSRTPLLSTTAFSTPAVLLISHFLLPHFQSPSPAAVSLSGRRRELAYFAEEESV